MGELVRLEVDADTRVATIRLDRPPMNALSAQMWQEIEEAAAEVSDRDDIGAVVVWGGPKVFAAGADIKEFPDWTQQDISQRVGPALQRSLDRVARIPVPTIAAVNGYALGGGCELALACDFRFGAENAKLGQPEILLGIIPGAGGTQRLPRLVGLSRAKELIFTGRMVDMTEAPAIGLVDAVYPADELYDRAVAAATVYAKGPYALRMAKRAIAEGIEGPLDEGLRLEQTLFAETFGSEDKQIGVASFIEHGPGKAEFTGR